MTNQPFAPRLSIPLEANLVGLATSFLEQGGLALGLAPTQALQLTLAGEEVFAYLANLAEPGDGLQLTLHGMGYAVAAEFILPQREVDLGMMNLTARPTPGDEMEMDRIGLLIASRSVEHFFVQETAEGGLSLNLIKEKVYPEAAHLSLPETRAMEEFTLARPSPEQLKDVAHLLLAGYSTDHYPPYMSLPGRLVDMVAGGEYAACVAIDKRQRLGGAMLWRNLGVNVHAYGPYLFGQPEGSPMAAALVEGCLGAVAKGEGLSLICRFPTPQMPPGYFEFLGELTLRYAGGLSRPWPHFYRQLREDPGASSWCHPCLEEFLRGSYRDLFLARDLRLTQPEGEARSPSSLIGARFDRTRGMVTLRLLWDGRDLADNIGRHLELLKGEGLPNVFFSLDLGRADLAAQAPVLEQAGFTPRLVLPWGGRGDLLMYQLAEGR